MNPEVDYTEKELETLTEAVLTSGLAVIMCEFTVISTPIEVATLARELMKAAKNHPNSKLIQTLFKEDARKEDSKEEANIEMTPENALATAIGKINAAVAILDQKAVSEEICEYKEFIYSCCDRVANAAGEGFFGTGKKVSPKEAATLEKLKAALKL